MLNTTQKWPFFLAVVLVIFWNPAYSQHESLLIPSETSRVRLSNSYSPQFLSILQIVYGSTIISQGGPESVDVMFSNINLHKMNVLDVGSGFGGVDIYLAQKYEVNILGVEREPYMTMKAEQFLSNHSEKLKGHVAFQILKDPYSLTEFPDNSFDIVFCKEVLYNIPFAQKQKYIEEMYRVLNPSGKLVIADWVSGTPELSERLQRESKKGANFFLTPQATEQILLNIGFSEISCNDLTESHIKYNKDDLIRIHHSKELICQKFGIDTYERIVESWLRWLEVLEYHELQSALFIGTKPKKME